MTKQSILELIDRKIDYFYNLEDIQERNYEIPNHWRDINLLFTNNSITIYPMQITVSQLRKELKYFRTKYKLSQQDIANSIGVSLLTIFRFENGKAETSINTVLNIFEFLKKQYPNEGLELLIEYMKKDRK